MKTNKKTQYFGKKNQMLRVVKLYLTNVKRQKGRRASFISKILEYLLCLSQFFSTFSNYCTGFLSSLLYFAGNYLELPGMYICSLIFKSIFCRLNFLNLPNYMFCFFFFLFSVFLFSACCMLWGSNDTTCLWFIFCSFAGQFHLLSNDHVRLFTK